MLPYMPFLDLAADAMNADILRRQIAREIESVRLEAAFGEGPPPYRTAIMIPEWPPRRITAAPAASAAALERLSAPVAAPDQSRAPE